MIVYAIAHKYWAAGYEVEAILTDQTRATELVESLNKLLCPSVGGVEFYTVMEYELDYTADLTRGH